MAASASSRSARSEPQHGFDGDRKRFSIRVIVRKEPIFFGIEDEEFVKYRARDQFPLNKFVSTVDRKLSRVIIFDNT